MNSHDSSNILGVIVNNEKMLEEILLLCREVIQ